MNALTPEQRKRIRLLFQVVLAMLVYLAVVLANWQCVEHKVYDYRTMLAVFFSLNFFTFIIAVFALFLTINQNTKANS